MRVSFSKSVLLFLLLASVGHAGNQRLVRTSFFYNWYETNAIPAVVVDSQRNETPGTMHVEVGLPRVTRRVTNAGIGAISAAGLVGIGPAGLFAVTLLDQPHVPALTIAGFSVLGLGSAAGAIAGWTMVPSDREHAYFRPDNALSTRAPDLNVPLAQVAALPTQEDRYIAVWDNQSGWRNRRVARVVLVKDKQGSIENVLYELELPALASGVTDVRQSRIPANHASRAISMNTFWSVGEYDTLFFELPNGTLEAIHILQVQNGRVQFVFHREVVDSHHSEIAVHLANVTEISTFSSNYQREWDEAAKTTMMKWLEHVETPGVLPETTAARGANHVAILQRPSGQTVRQIVQTLRDHAIRHLNDAWVPLPPITSATQHSPNACDTAIKAMEVPKVVDTHIF